MFVCGLRCGLTKIYFHRILRWYKSGIVFVLTKNTARSTQNVGPAKTQIHSFIYMWMYCRNQFCFLMNTKKIILCDWFVTCFVIGYYHRRCRNHEFKSGVSLNALSIINHILSLGPKLLLSDHLLFCNAFDIVM